MMTRLRMGISAGLEPLLKRNFTLSGFGLLILLPLLHSGGAGMERRSASETVKEKRIAMVEEQIARRGVRDERVLAAMRSVPRHRFVPAEVQAQAYEDYPLPIGWDQTISQPFIVALMADLLEAKGDEKVLEIGTGSGYHAAVMAELVGEVYTIEIVEPLGRRARETLRELGIDNVHVRIGDGYQGWPEEAPFDAIVLTAAPPKVPEPLLEQLKVGGRLILPLGKATQDLVVMTRTAEGFETRTVAAVRFVPMTGAIQEGVR